MTKKISIIDYYFPSCTEKKLSLKEVDRLNKMFSDKGNAVIEEAGKMYSPKEWERKTKKERKKLLKEVEKLFQIDAQVDSLIASRAGAWIETGKN